MVFDFLRSKEESFSSSPIEVGLDTFNVSTGKKRQKDKFLLTLAEEFVQKRGKKLTKVQKLEKRVSPKKLELAARLDELSSRCVNFYATQVAGPGFDIVCEDENSKTVYEEFIERTHLILKLEDVIRDMCIMGNGWFEKIFNIEETPTLINVEYIDSRFMDFMRTSNGLVDEDEYGEIRGYSFKPWLGTEEPIKPEKVVWFPLFSRGNELALGFVEPLYRTIYDKLNAREGFSQQQWRSGFPLWTAKVGMPPNPKTGFAGVSPKKEVIDKMADEMEDLKSKHKIIHPYYVEIVKHEPSAGRTPAELLEFFNQSICAGFGIPYDLAMGMGKANRASLEVATVRDLDRRIHSIQERISTILINEIFSILKEQHNLKELPVLKWREITPPDLNRLAKRFKEYTDAGIVISEDARELVYKLEGIKEKPREEEPEEDIKPVGPDQIKEFEKLLEARNISLEESISFLKTMRDSFPGETIQRTIDYLIQQLMLKTTGIETQPTGMSEDDR